MGRGWFVVEFFCKPILGRDIIGNDWATLQLIVDSAIKYSMKILLKNIQIYLVN